MIDWAQNLQAGDATAKTTPHNDTPKRRPKMMPQNDALRRAAHLRSGILFDRSSLHHPPPGGCMEEEMMGEPTYKDLKKWLDGQKSSSAALVPIWLSFRGKSLRDPLCEPLYLPGFGQWKLYSNQFRMYVRATSPELDRNSYQRKTLIPLLREAAIRLASHHRYPAAARRLDELRAIVAKKTPKTWRTRVMPLPVRDFIAGRRYAFSKRCSGMNRIETVCGLDRGVLLAASLAANPPKLAKDLRPVGRNLSPRKSTSIPLTPILHQFVQSYIEHKTKTVPDIRRYSRWSPNFRGEYKSASIFEWFVMRRFSFMTRSPQAEVTHPEHGLGLDPASIKPVDLFRLDIGTAHFKWGVAARKGVSKSFAWMYFSFSIAMLNDKSGFMYQQPDVFASQLRPADYPGGRRPSSKQLPNAFKRWCERGYKDHWDFILSLDLRDAQLKHARIRNPRAKLDIILDMPRPMEALFELVREHRRNGATTLFENEYQRCSYHMTTFFIVALTSAPLRLTTWCAVRVGQHIFRQGGRWHLKLERALFKNRRHMKAESYEVTLPNWATPFFDYYIDVVRPQLLGAKAGSPYLFTYVEPPLSDAAMHGPVSTSVLRMRLNRATEAFWGAPVGAHSWRHIVATAILKDDPSAILRAAYVLNDRPETVERVYAHLTNREMFSGFANWGDRLWREGDKRR